MFKKMRKRIFNSVFYVVLAFVLLISGVSFGVTASNLQRSQRQRTQSNAESAVTGIERYLSAVMGFVEQTSRKKSVIDAVESVDIYGVSRALDGLCGYAVKIDGAILYGSDGYVVYSSGVGTPPSFNELMEIEDIRQFYLSSREGYVSMRKRAVAHTYNSVFYNTSKGIVSVMRKIYSQNGEVIGLLTADVTPETLSSVKLVYNSFGVRCDAFLACDELLTDDEAFNGYYATTERGTTKDKKYYVANSDIPEGGRVVLFAPLNKFAQRLALMAGILFAIDVILISLGALFAVHVASAVVDPLDKLLERMSKQN